MPIWPIFVAPVLSVLVNGEVIHRLDIPKQAIDLVGLSHEARAETLESRSLRA